MCEVLTGSPFEPERAAARSGFRAVLGLTVSQSPRAANAVSTADAPFALMSRYQGDGIRASGSNLVHARGIGSSDAEVETLAVF
jgi:hypothetical protein